MIKRITLILIASVLILSCTKPEKPVAKVNGRWISYNELTTYFDMRNIDRNDDSKVQKAVDDFIKREICYEMAKKKGLLSKSFWGEQVERIKKNVVIYNYIVEKYLNGSSEPSKEEMEEAFKAEKCKRHLFGVAVKGKERAMEVYRQLLSGGNIKEIFEKHKGEIENAPQNFDLGFAPFNSLPAEIQKVFYSAKEGDVVEPIPFGGEDNFMVVVIKEVVVPPIPDKFDDNLKRKTMSIRFQKSLLKANEELKSTYPESVDFDLIEKLIKNDNPTEDQLKTNIGVVGSKKIKFVDLLDAYYSESQKINQLLIKNRETFKMLFDKIAAEERVYTLAKEKGFLKKERVKAEIFNREHEIGASMFRQDFINEYVVKDEDLKEYYEKNKQLFLGETKFKLKYIVAESPDALNEAVKVFKSGAKWEDVLKTKGVLPETGNGSLGVKSESELSVLFDNRSIQKLKTMEIGKWLGENMGQNRIVGFYLEDRETPPPLPFEECKKEVRKEYLKAKGNELLDKFIEEEGKKKIKVLTFPQNFK